MNGKCLLILLLVLSGLMLLGVGASLALGQAPPAPAPEGVSASYRLDWVSVGEVSGGESASAQYHLSATIGQMGASTRSESTHYALCVVFQCAAADAVYRVYLPLVFR